MSVTFDRPQADGIDEIAAAKKVSAAWVVRDAVNEYLQHHGKTERRAG